jgi:hypothetical protein
MDVLADATGIITSSSGSRSIASSQHLLYCEFRFATPLAQVCHNEVDSSGMLHIVEAGGEIAQVEGVQL